MIREFKFILTRSPITFDWAAFSEVLAPFGQISTLHPQTIPGELQVFTATPQADTAAFEVAVKVALRDGADMPPPKPPVDIDVFRRALVKAARGKPLNAQEADELDRIERS